MSNYPKILLQNIVSEHSPITYGVVTAGDYLEDGVLMVRSQDYSNGWVEKENIVRISPSIEKNYFRSRLTPGDILITVVGAGVGNLTIAPNFQELTNISRSTARISIAPEKANPDYIYQVLCTPYYLREVKKLAIGGAQPVLNLNKLATLPIHLPPLPVQKAIAETLGAWDRAIALQEKLIAAKTQRLKWLMQVLLTGKRRLKGFGGTKWKARQLDQFIEPVVRAVPKPSKPYLGIGLRSHGKGTFLKYNELPEKNTMDQFYIVRPNDLIVNITFAWEQAIAIAKPEDDGALASHRFPTYTFIEGKGVPNFFRYFIVQPRMKFMLQLISPGGAGRNRVMNKSDFLQLEFLIPEYQEQDAIAQVLGAAEKELDLLKLKAEKLNKQKTGLMQKILNR